MSIVDKPSPGRGFAALSQLLPFFAQDHHSGHGNFLQSHAAERRFQQGFITVSTLALWVCSYACDAEAVEQEFL